MKMSHELTRPDMKKPLFGLVLGALLTLMGIALWMYAPVATASAHQDESLAVSAILIGLFIAIYAGRELRHQRR